MKQESTNKFMGRYGHCLDRAINCPVLVFKTDLVILKGFDSVI